jgi:hypothetical protein
MHISRQELCTAELLCCNVLHVMPTAACTIATAHLQEASCTIAGMPYSPLSTVVVHMQEWRCGCWHRALWA